MPKINGPKRKFSTAWLLLLILLLTVAGGIYCLTATKVTPPFSEVSHSTNISTLEKELDDTDLGSFETDLNQLDTDAGQL